MSTEIYGRSDDLVEFDGDVNGEVGCYATDDNDRGLLVVVSDGTLLEVKYGKQGRAIWAVTLVRKGSKFQRIDQCDDENAGRYSDVAVFDDGLKWAYAAREWEPVK
jgi:hypothetical protein